MSDKKDTVEINLGFLKNIKRNPWVLSSIILLIALVFVFFNGGSGGVGEDVAAKNLVDFINSQGDSPVTLVGVKKVDSLYEVTINAEGQDVPLYVTLDGKFAVLPTQVIPLSGDLPDSGDTGDEGTGSGGVQSIDISNSPVKGQETAEVIIVEFSDYECPFCGRFYSQTFGLIEENYVDTGKVKYVFRDFPLSFHQNAQKAAEAARCVRDLKGDVGYFKFHDKLFEGQGELSDANYRKWALELGANINSCLESGKHAAGVLEDMSYGQSLGISGTPGFFIGNEENGYTIISGAQPYSVFEQVLESYLA
ncbi:hypothetical protein CMI45_00290 [Candidatus Pacearchaeota archaeon]|nr:hypothetical protein [Candidatus Pacearchaeota archaeon]|tara:strand:- start:2587 stop:3510 length:924 start_codon:yes stop_codon:yes gene_type:complete